MKIRNPLFFFKVNFASALFSASLGGRAGGGARERAGLADRRASGRAGGQTDGLTDRRASVHRSERAGERPGGWRTGGWADERACERAGGRLRVRTSGRADGRTSGRPGCARLCLEAHAKNFHGSCLLIVPWGTLFRLCRYLWSILIAPINIRGFRPRSACSPALGQDFGPVIFFHRGAFDSRFEGFCCVLS